MFGRKMIHAITGETADEALRQRLTHGRELFGGTVLTNREIVFSKGISRQYIPLDEINWAFRRVEESHVTLGCCGGVLQDFHVILRHTSGREVKLTFDREQVAVAVLDHIAQNSQAAIGYTEENKARFLSLKAE